MDVRAGQSKRQQVEEPTPSNLLPRRLSRGPWAARRSNQSILKEINPEHSVKGLRLELKLRSFGHLMGSADSLEETLMLGRTEGRERDRG